MDLVEETAAYLDGAGRQDSKLLSRSAALAYAAESMRLTTRLMQVASWLLVQRAVREGDMARRGGAGRQLSAGAPKPPDAERPGPPSRCPSRWPSCWAAPSACSSACATSMRACTSTSAPRSRRIRCSRSSSGSRTPSAAEACRASSPRPSWRRAMTELTYIQGGDDGRRVWRRRLGAADSPSTITVLNGKARRHWITDATGAFSIKWMPRGRAVYRSRRRQPLPLRRPRRDPQPGAALRAGVPGADRRGVVLRLRLRRPGRERLARHRRARRGR